MKYKLIAADMDGTLLNDRHELTERTITAITGAVEAGVLFVTATGRPFYGIGIVNDHITGDMPFIIFNGASVVMGKSKEMLFRKQLDASLAKEVYALGMERGIPLIMWTEQLWCNSECKATMGYRKYFDLDMRIIENIDDFEDEFIYKFIWFGMPDVIGKLQSEMQEHFRGRLNCHTSQPEYLEFVGPDADKGSAMAELGRVYDIDRSEMIAIGDGHNDISMLKYAGLGIAMENAPEAVKAVCGEVTLSNNNDGVAAVIEKYIL